MAQSNTVLEELRGMVYDRPSWRTFRQIALVLDRCSGVTLNVALNYLLPQLTAWPVETRRVPVKWMKRLMKGKEEPRLILCTSLSLADKGLDDATLVRVLRQPHLASLVELDLSSNDVGPEVFEVIARDAYLMNLQDLNLSGARPGEAGLAALGEAALPHLKALRLGGCDLGDDEVALLATTDVVRSVGTLVLDHGFVCDEGAEALVAAPNLRRLEVLDLSFNRLTARGIMAFDAIGELVELRELRLRGNEIWDVSWENFSDPDRMQRLVRDTTLGPYYWERWD